MKNNSRNSDPQKVVEELERERREMEDIFSIKAGEEEKLREQEIRSECTQQNVSHTLSNKLRFISNIFMGNGEECQPCRNEL